jgi:hypothetical protein
MHGSTGRGWKRSRSYRASPSPNQPPVVPWQTQGSCLVLAGHSCSIPAIHPSLLRHRLLVLRAPAGSTWASPAATFSMVRAFGLPVACSLSSRRTPVASAPQSSCCATANTPSWSTRLRGGSSNQRNCRLRQCSLRPAARLGDTRSRRYSHYRLRPVRPTRPSRNESFGPSQAPLQA